jgi:iron-sulfur cluster repair protein YtfE (RIC family)
MESNMAARMTGRMAAFATGALAGLIASRALPPLLAQAGGMARGSAGRDPFDVLVQDHRAIAALLDDMEQSPNDALFERAQKLFRLKRRLTAHAMAEEDVIYPLLFEQIRNADDARHLYSEHAAMKVHLYALENMPKDDPAWSGRVHELKSLIEGHVQQEEDVDFPKLRDELDDITLSKLFGKMQREKALLL